MSRPVSDTELRDAVRSLAPGVDGSSFHRELGERCAAKRQGHRRGQRTRVWAIGAAVVALLVAVGFGVNALVERMGQDEGIVMITDDGMSPGGTSQGAPDPTSTETTTLTGAKAELWAEIQRIREGVESGELTFGWTASEAAGGNLPSDPMLMLDSLEESLLGPDVTVYYLGGDSAGDASALRTEVSAMPGVARLEFLSKDDALQRLKEDFADNPEVLSDLTGNPLPASLEVWMTDYAQAASLANELRNRPEVEEVVLAPSMDYAQWVERLRSLTRKAVLSASGTTLTTLPAPLPESAWPYPDYTPLPEEVPSEEVRQLAERVAAHFPELGFQVISAIEIRYPSNTIINFGLALEATEVESVGVTIFMTERGIPESETSRALRVEIPGAKDSYLIEEPRPSGSGYEHLQLLALMADDTVVNATSSRTAASEDAEPPLDRDGLIDMVTYVVALINGGRMPLPDLRISTSTTLAWAHLPQEIANAGGGTALNAFSHVAYGKEAEFQSLLAPEARDENNTAYASERERFKASGMSADEYSSPRSVVIAQWKQGAYLTDLGYFTQTRPPVPDELDAWLRQDPDVRAAAGVTMRDETVRWIRLEAQTDGSWLMVP